MRGTVAQKLIRRIEGGLVPALEIMTSTPAIADYIAKNKMSDIDQLFTKSSSPSLCSMNNSIYTLYKTGLITKESAIEASDNQAELMQLMRGVYHGISDRDLENLI